MTKAGTRNRLRRKDQAKRNELLNDFYSGALFSLPHSDNHEANVQETVQDVDAALASEIEHAERQALIEKYLSSQTKASNVVLNIKKYAYLLSFLTSTIAFAVVLIFLLSTFVRINDITGQIPSLSKTTTVPNQEDLLTTINNKIQDEVFPDVDFSLQKNDLLASLSQNPDTPQGQQSIEINSTLYYNFPSYQIVQEALLKWLDEQKVPQTDDVNAGIKSVATNVSLRYSSFGDQLKSSEDEILKDLNEQQQNLILAALALLLLAQVIIILIQRTFVSGDLSLGLVKLKISYLIIWIFAVVFGSAMIGVLVAPTLSQTIYPSKFEVRTDTDTAEPMKLEDMAVQLIDEPQKPLYMEPFGQIDVDSQNIHQSVIEGTTAESLAQSAGHMSFSAWPGELGPVVIAGHNMSEDQGTWQRDFGKIYYLEVGELFTITTDYGKFVYQVTDNHVEAADGYDLLEKTTDRGHRFAILYSCYPIDSGDTPDRTFITAEQISGPLVKLGEGSAAGGSALQQQ
ncbi:hypothetical protein FACS1894125_4670 [Actinomycetota bacterium]|nr:hypothetical protein FACS1894125_4670 [Actinomycetota bacterium]